MYGKSCQDVTRLERKALEADARALVAETQKRDAQDQMEVVVLSCAGVTAVAERLKKAPPILTVSTGKPEGPFKPVAVSEPEKVMVLMKDERAPFDGILVNTIKGAEAALALERRGEEQGAIKKLEKNLGELSEHLAEETRRRKVWKKRTLFLGGLAVVGTGTYLLLK